ncbi:MAG: hypothetical protein JWM33_134 [Caulobacteraceae bacterium]|nr:hypothetical protein [Caulobacteraceae bacterium]
MKLSRRWLAVLFWLALAAVTVVTLAPARYEQLPVNIWDKAEHFVGFGGLAGLAMLAWPRRHAGLIVVLLTLYGGLIEIVQGMVGRDRDWHDALADTLGMLAAWAVLVLLRRAGMDLRAVSR